MTAFHEGYQVLWDMSYLIYLILFVDVEPIYHFLMIFLMLYEGDQEDQVVHPPEMLILFVAP